ncbi:MAG: hypothetical protein ACRDUA_05775 [Micromonosporaceae bacterium]
MPNPQISRLRLLGLMFCLLGATLITLGWMGTAKYAYVDQQMPYLLSGGAAGLGLIVVGIGLLVIAQLRVEADKIAERLAALAPRGDEPVIPSQRVEARTHDTEPLPVARTSESKPDPETEPSRDADTSAHKEN